MNLRSSPEDEQSYTTALVTFEGSKKRLGFEKFATSTYFETEPPESRFQGYPLNAV